MTKSPKLPGLDDYESAGAEFDAGRIYRYSLHRMWGGGRTEQWRTVLWVMLNPSTADENVLDPTLRRCENFTRAWGYHGFEVCNLFAYRSTDPDALPDVACDIIGNPQNDEAIRTAGERNDLIVVGWGSHKVAGERAKTVAAMLSRMKRTMRCLGTNQDGSPWHPLYIAASTPLKVWQP
jgi:hypothetical protein